MQGVAHRNQSLHGQFGYSGLLFFLTSQLVLDFLSRILQVMVICSIARADLWADLWAPLEKKAPGKLMKDFRGRHPRR